MSEQHKGGMAANPKSFRLDRHDGHVVLTDSEGGEIVLSNYAVLFLMRELAEHLYEQDPPEIGAFGR